MSHGDSSIQYKIDKAEVKKLVKKDKMDEIYDELDELNWGIKDRMEKY